MSSIKDTPNNKITTSTQFYRFSIVSVGGLFFNEAILFSMYEFVIPVLEDIFSFLTTIFDYFADLGFKRYAFAASFAILVVTIWNYSLNKYWSFEDKSEADFRQFLAYCIVGASGVVVNLGILITLTEFVGIYYLISGAIGFVVSVITNFIFNKIWTFGSAFTGEKAVGTSHDS
ncbi:MAG: GtrA family protein [Promethearchaeota archaeon]